MTRAQMWLANVALVCAAVLVALGAAEAVIRIAKLAPASIYAADSTTLYRLIPGGRKTFTHNATNGGGKVLVDINDDGFRGPSLRKDATARRVMVYGDSFIEGEFAPDSLTFVRMLERQLNSGTPTEVVNAGVVGWGPDQAFLRMQHDVSSLAPKLVLLGIFADNDMGDLVRDRLFRLAPDSTIEPHRVTLHPILLSALSKQASPTGWRRSHLVRLIERKIRRPSESLPATRDRANEPKFSLTGYAEWAQYHADRQFGDLTSNPDTVLDLLGDSYDVDISTKPDAPSTRYKLALMDRLLARTQEYLQQQKTPFALIVIPSPIDVCGSGYDISIDSTKYPQYDRRRISGSVVAMAARHGIKYIDLWPAFEQANACKLYYRGGDLHWNELGQSIAARLTSDSLQAWNLAK